jgi:hypothetical protein
MAFEFPAKYTRKIELNTSREIARESIVHTLRLLGWSSSRPDADTFLITPLLSWFSFGEAIKISLSVEPGSLYIESKCLGLVIGDWGKNEKNVSDFLALFDEHATRNSTLIDEMS